MADTLKKMGMFFLCFFAVIGLIGGFGVAMYSGSYFIGVCVAVLGYFAYPKFKSFIQEFIEVKK